jgi:hypothetical protein
MSERDRRSSRRRFLQTAFLGTVLGTTGCLRFAGGDETTEPATTEAQTTERDATPRPTPTDTATRAPTRTPTPANQPDGATFRFEYAADEQRVVIRYAGGGRLRAGSVEIESSSSNAVGWPNLGSTIARSDEFLQQGATAVLGPNILNWEQAPDAGETIRVVFDGQGTTATLGRFTVPDTATPSPTPTEAPTDTPTEAPTETPAGTPTATETGEADGTFQFSRGGMAGRETEEYLATMPLVEMVSDGRLQTLEIDGSTAFRIRNTDTGTSVRLSVDEGQSLRTKSLTLLAYSARGTIAGEPRVRGEPVDATGYDPKELSATIESDADTFSAEPFAGYRVTIFQDGTALDATEIQELPVGHPKEFDSTVGDTIEWSFNAGEMPGEAIEVGWIRTEGGDRVETESLRYDESANRYVASLSASAVPDGTHRAVIECTDPDSGVGLAHFSNRLTV